MGTGPGNSEIAAGAGGVPWTRATLVWMLIMLLETGHGLLRAVIIAQAIGDLRARQWGVLVGSLLVMLIALLLSRWMRAVTTRTQLIVGSFWVALTVTFEILLARATHTRWDRLVADYDPTQGGYMLLGLAVMFMAPWLAAKCLAYWKR